MSLKSFKRVSTNNVELSKTQDNITAAIEPIIAKVVIDGVLLKDVILISGQANVVSHGLGRELLGWIIVGKTANASIWDEQASNVFKAKTLQLQTSADVTVNLWVF